jgi:predicted metal-dependent enzyme (double-stranded beta helix superfamily)
VENRLSTSVAKLAVLKTVKEWIVKGFVAGPFKEPPVDNFRVNGMIAIIKGKRYLFF